MYKTLIAFIGATLLSCCTANADQPAQPDPEASNTKQTVMTVPAVKEKKVLRAVSTEIIRHPVEGEQPETDEETLQTTKSLAQEFSDKHEEIMGWLKLKTAQGKAFWAKNQEELQEDSTTSTNVPIEHSLKTKSESSEKVEK